MAVILALGLVLACTGDLVAAASAEEAYREGTRLYREGRVEAAAEAFERAVSLDPRSVKSLLKLGVARSRLNDGEAAIAAYRRILELDPRHVKALNNVANVYFRQGRYEHAAEWYQKALDVDPDYIFAVYHYGWVLRHENRNEEAERHFRHCLALPGERPEHRRTQLDCLFYLGSLRFRAGDHAAAAELMERVLAVHRAHPEARYYLGMAYRKLGRTDEARQQLEIHRQLLRATRSSEPIERQDEP